MGMFSQNEILLMILVVSVLLIFIVVLTILDIRDYHKEKNQNELDLDNVLEDNLLEQQVDIKPLEEEMVEVLEVPNEEKEEVLQIDNHEEKLDVEPLTKENVVKEEVIPNNQYQTIDMDEEYMPRKLSLDEELSKIEETMVDTEEKLEKTITSFEEEQERTAIISLDELLKHSDNLYSQNEITQYNDDNAPISIEEAMMTMNNDVVIENKDVEIPQVLEESLKEEKPLYTHKEDMPFISSIYGVENDLSFENTANYEKMDRAKTNEFMRKLKEMSENK